MGHTFRLFQMIYQLKGVAGVEIRPVSSGHTNLTPPLVRSEVVLIFYSFKNYRQIRENSEILKGYSGK